LGYQTLKRPGPQWKLQAAAAEQSLNWPGAPWKLKAAASGLPKPLYSVRDDPRCGVIPNACGVLTRFEFILERNPSTEREREAEELKDYGCDTRQLSGDAIFSYVIVRNSKVITERTESDHINQ
jgi:hypothetical protein